MCGGAYMRGLYMWSHTNIKDKVGLSVGGGGDRWRNTVLVHWSRSRFDFYTSSTVTQQPVTISNTL